MYWNAPGQSGQGQGDTPPLLTQHIKKQERRGREERAGRLTEARDRPKLVDWCFIWISILWSRASICCSSNPFLRGQTAQRGSVLFRRHCERSFPDFN